MTYFVGIDIAKFKHDCFISDENGCVVRDSFSFKNDKDGFKVLLSILKDLKPKGQIKIGFESTGHYHFNLKLFLEANGFDYVEFNPLLVHKFVAGQTLRRTKTDKKDSKLITKYLMNCAETFYVHNPVISDFYWKKRNEGKHHNVALSHVARKLVNTIFTLEKYKVDFDANLLK